MKRRKYQDVLHDWNGGEPTQELFDALGRLALGDMAGRMIGSMFFIPIGKRVFQLLEIAIENAPSNGNGQ